MNEALKINSHLFRMCMETIIAIFMRKPTKLCCSSLYRMQDEIIEQKEFQLVTFEVCQ
jgi:hypothetical protein